MTYKELEKYFNVGNSYFSTLKHNNKDMFSYIFGDDKNKSDRKPKMDRYLKEKEYILSKCEEIYYSFDKSKELNDFLVRNKLYANFSTSYCAFEKMLFKEQRLIIRSDMWNKLKDIVEAYEKEQRCVKTAKVA